MQRGNIKWMAAMGVATALLVASCGMFKRQSVIVSPPLIPGAEYVGDATCKTCHPEQFKYFELSEHASVQIALHNEKGQKVCAESCETCHGPGSLHVQGGGDKCKILVCNPETCFVCHRDIQARFNMQYHHPVPEGWMTCSSCHNMHGNDVHAIGKRGLDDKDEVCFACHKAQKGPFIEEHDAMRDGCSVCHNPHGSVNDGLLHAGPNTLCLGCHYTSSLNSACKFGPIGSSNTVHTTRNVGTGSTCIDCHIYVHGSNHTTSTFRD